MVTHISQPAARHFSCLMTEEDGEEEEEEQCEQEI